MNIDSSNRETSSLPASSFEETRKLSAVTGDPSKPLEVGDASSSFDTTLIHRGGILAGLGQVHEVLEPETSSHQASPDAVGGGRPGNINTSNAVTTLALENSHLQVMMDETMPRSRG